MSRAPIVSLAAVLLPLVACSNDERVEPPTAAEEASVFDPMTRSIDRAQDLEATLNQRVDELNQRLEESEGE